MIKRADGLTYPGFWCLQMFDSEGCHGSVRADERDQLIQKAAKISASKNIIACSLPYRALWVPSSIGPGLVPDVSLPTNWKDALASLDKGKEED